MTSSVNTFKEKHQHHSDDVNKNKQNNWTRTGQSLTLRARQEVKQLVTGRDYVTEVGRTKGADPALKTDHFQEAGSCWTSKFFLWNLHYDQVRLSLRMMSIHDVNSEGTKQTDKNSTQWDEVGSCHETSKPPTIHVRAIKYTILLKEVWLVFPILWLNEY